MVLYSCLVSHFKLPARDANGASIWAGLVRHMHSGNLGTGISSLGTNTAWEVACGYLSVSERGCFLPYMRDVVQRSLL